MPPPSSYLALIRRFPLRPLNSDEDLESAIEVMNSLLDRDDLDAAEKDYLVVLSGLVESYEDEHYSIATEDLTDAEMLEHLIEAKGVSQAETAQGAEIAQSTISEVLSGRRHLTRTQVEKLAAFFHVTTAVFPAIGGNGEVNRSAASKKSGNRL